MSPARWCSLLPWLSVCALALACVPEVEIAGAPCPCPEGFSCCATNGNCVASTDQCPPTYPHGSGQSCRCDADCHRTERCHAWNAQGVAGGPGLCQPTCAPGSSCASGDVCALVPHDGAPLGDMKLTRLCVPTTPSPGCEAQGCSKCGEHSPGEQLCNGNARSACFFALHPQCGLVCELVGLRDCLGSQCLERGGQTECLGVDEATPLCDRFSCEACPSAEPFTCQDERLVACVATPFADKREQCERLCSTTSMPCEHGCSEDGGAHCAP